MSILEVAKVMNVSHHTVRMWVRTKQLKAKITKYGYLITREDLEKFKEKRKEVK